MLKTAGDKGGRLTVPKKPFFGTVSTDLAGRITFADLHYSEILGRPLDELLDRNMIDLTHDADRERTIDHFDQMVHLGTSFSILKRYLWPNLSSIHALTHVTLLRDRNASAVGSVAVVQVLTKSAYAMLQEKLVG